MKVQVNKEKNETCAIQLAIFDLVNFYQNFCYPATYVYTNLDLDTYRAKDVGYG